MKKKKEEQHRNFIKNYENKSNTKGQDDADMKVYNDDDNDSTNTPWAVNSAPNNDEDEEDEDFDPDRFRNDRERERKEIQANMDATEFNSASTFKIEKLRSQCFDQPSPQ